ncbi:hypothetical protein M752DRAFT_284441 [Aspergillus phoenicis ATCC 13157]|uniref:Uncharacterized protein n=1 Tax=Aspergillus phoenicis ATCC 13157 TaxID=1353007 RepID=A0A370PHP4_ASPPH|nr:hypothetical protein M752DRAFT_284441 [Aspergillus phoenicis ATCC 13157]
MSPTTENKRCQAYEHLINIFQIHSPYLDKQRILNIYIAPEGFLRTALRVNPKARAIGFSLLRYEEDHNILLSKYPNISVKFIDITLLTADMGLLEIPNNHPDTGKFLPRQFESGQAFDLVIYNNQVLRNHDRATYHKHQEASRLTLTQLALGLEHIKLEKTMIILLHKHPRFHAKRSSFYILTTNIRTDCPDAAMAIQGTNNIYNQALQHNVPDINLILKNFGPRLAVLDKHI